MNPSKFTHATKEEKIQQFDPYEEQGGRGEEKSEEEAHIDERNRCFTMLREREISQNSHPRKRKARQRCAARPRPKERAIAVAHLKNAMDGRDLRRKDEEGRETEK